MYFLKQNIIIFSVFQKILGCQAIFYIQ
uniref:Uncharacterized protein n=1 Tax=Anguilla anguilla TaxID=7936 RepID=A0A0E9VKF2_ANGAN